MKQNKAEYFGIFVNKDKPHHCVKSVRIQSFSGPYFAISGLNTERYSVPFRIQSECGKIRIRKTPNTGTFYAMSDFFCAFYNSFSFGCW